MLERPWVKYYDSGIKPIEPIPGVTYVDMLEEGLELKPDRIAMYYMGRALTFRDLDKLSAGFCAYLRKKGMGKGNVVGINLPNLPQYMIALAGALRAGCAVTGISPLLTPKELAYQINDSNASILVTMDSFFEERLLKIKDKIPGLKQVVTTNAGDYLPALKRVIGNLLKKIPSGKVIPIHGKVVVDFKNILEEEPDLNQADPIEPGHTCLIQYTGGTTGLPKGTILTHANMVANTIHAKNWTGWGMGEDVLLSGFPFFHLAGLAFGMLAMATGNTQCLIPDPRNTGHICNEIKNHRPTVMANVPTLYQMLMDNNKFKGLNFSNLKSCVSGAAPFSVDAINNFESIAGKGKIMEVYGMTEASPLLTMNPFNGKKKIGSVGLPIQNTEIKIVDLETGTKEMPTGKEGELIAKGPQIMKEYHNRPEETANTLRNFNGENWLYTGDVARIDDDGYIYIVDRSKDMIIVGGYKVFSREVEESLYQLKEIEFCAIVGIDNPDRPGSEIVKAVIQPTKEVGKIDKEALTDIIKKYCRENMAPYKVPKLVEFVDAIPLTAVGKVDKKALR